MNDYLDFELLIERVGDRYRARVLESPAGSGEGLPFDLPSEEDFRSSPPAAARHLEIRKEPGEEDAGQIGLRLFQMVFTGPVLEIWRGSLGRSNNRLRLWIRLGDDPRLLNVPWELCVDPTLGPLAIRIPVVRTFEIPVAPRLLEAQAQLRVLAVLSSPPNLPRLDVEGDWRALDEAFGDNVKLETVPPTLDRIDERLRETRWHVLHFVGHGSMAERGGVLYLEDLSENAQPVDHLRLGTFLGHESLQLVVINACEGARTDSRDASSGVAQALLRRGVPAVVAMQQPISDRAAITFARHFYGALAKGLSVAGAMMESRKVLLREHKAEWAIPVLYLNDSDGLLVIPKGSEDGWPLWLKIAIALAVVLLGFVLWLGFKGAEPPPETPEEIKIPRGAKGNPKDCYSPPELDIAFVAVPAGKFPMGEKRGQQDVVLTKPFCLGAYEVTRGLWERVLRNQDVPESERYLPVQGVTFEEAQQFIARLNEIDTSGHYRFPTEAEWERAARAGTRTRYFFGDDSKDLVHYANCKGRFPRPIPVGQLEPNPWGLYDMYGNVFEWVSDWYAPAPLRSLPDPKGPQEGERRIRRGGSWESGAKACTSAARSHVDRDRNDQQNGLRIVRAIM